MFVKMEVLWWISCLLDAVEKLFAPTNLLNRLVDTTHLVERRRDPLKLIILTAREVREAQVYRYLCKLQQRLTHFDGFDTGRETGNWASHPLLCSNKLKTIAVQRLIRSLDYESHRKSSL